MGRTGRLSVGTDRRSTLLAVTRRIPPRAALAPVAVAAALAGCGAGAQPSFVARADAICAGALRQLRALPPAPAAGGSPLAGYLARALPIVRAEARAVAALPRPGESARRRARLDAFLAALHTSAADLAALSAAAQRGDAAAVAVAAATLRASPLPALAAGYGLRACGSPGATVT